MNLKKRYLLVLLFISQISFSQEGIAVYSDYLSDNYYLIHPSMAGAANCSKLRLTGRKQWFNQNDAPELQTLSFNGRVGEKSGAGIILFNDKRHFIFSYFLILPYQFLTIIRFNTCSFILSINIIYLLIIKSIKSCYVFIRRLNGSFCRIF